MYANVIVQSHTQNFQDTFSYAIPTELQQQIQPGHRVRVPFGRRSLSGMVLSLSDHLPETIDPAKIKPLRELVSQAPVLSPLQLQLASWLSQHYRASLKSCVETVSPFAFKAPPQLPQVHVISRHPDFDQKLSLATRLGPQQKKILQQLETSQQLHITRLTDSHKSLEEKELIQRTTQPFLPQVGDQSQADHHHQLQDQDLTSSQLQAVQQIVQAPMSQKFLLHGVTGSGKTEVYLHALQHLLFSADSKTEPIKAPNASKKRSSDMPTSLLKPVTEHQPQAKDSTKNENTVFPQAKPIQGTSEKKKESRPQALVLLPEISLTPQTFGRFARYFPEKVAPYHSKLSNTERYAVHHGVKHGNIQIVIGSRSSLFLPWQNLQCIILDEEHEFSYKQDRNPYYHAASVAEWLTQITGAKLILGSATPRVFSYAKAQHSDYQLLHLPRSIREELAKQSAEKKNIEKTPITVVDLREEFKRKNQHTISRQLKEELEKNLKNQELSILFLNRRGRSPYVFCRDCGHVLRCETCEIPFTYHTLTFGKPQLICHHCGQMKTPPDRCPECQSHHIHYLGAGTQKVVEDVQELFPEARIARLDTDTTGRKHVYEEMYEKLRKKEIDILVGTQIVAKGWDIPHATLVGIILAEQTLNFPDWQAGERTFQLLTQVLGRVGRAHQAGRAVLQTYDPENFYLQAALQKNYQGLYEAEMQKRKAYLYPPFVRLVKLSYSHPSEEKAYAEAEKIAQHLIKLSKQHNWGPLKVLGPAPAFIPRRNGKFTLHLILKSRDFAPLTPHLPLDWVVDLEPNSLL